MSSGSKVREAGGPDCRPRGMNAPSATRLVSAVCVAHVLTMLSFSSFATLLPQFRELWSLSNRQDGWISAAFILRPCGCRAGAGGANRPG